MAGADGIGTHLLHACQLAVHGVICRSRTQCTLVMVHAHAVELHSLTVQIEAVVRIKGIPAEAKLRVTGIHNRTVHSNLCPDIVQSGAIHIPQFRIADNRCCGYRRSSPCCNGSRIRGRLGYRFSLAVVYGIAYRDRCRCAAVIGHFYCRLHRSIPRLNVRCSDIGAVQRDMNRICHHQGNITVNAAAGIPAAGRNVIDCLDSNDIFRRAVTGDIIGNVKGKAVITIMVFTNTGAIDINIGVRINAVKVQYDALSRICCRQSKGFTIPAGSTRQETGFRFSAGGIALGDAEVMGQCHILPAGIIKIFVLCCTAGTQIKLPVGIKICFPAAGCYRRYLDGFCLAGHSACIRISCNC